MKLEKRVKGFIKSDEEKEQNNYEHLLLSLKESNKPAYKRTKKLNRIYNRKKFFEYLKK